MGKYRKEVHLVFLLKSNFVLQTVFHLKDSHRQSVTYRKVLLEITPYELELFYVGKIHTCVESPKTVYKYGYLGGGVSSITYKGGGVLQRSTGDVSHQGMEWAPLVTERKPVLSDPTDKILKYIHLRVSTWENIDRRKQVVSQKL